MVFCVRSTSAQCVGQGQHPLAPRKEPEVGTPEVPTMGSRNHRLGNCRPCVPRHEKTRTVEDFTDFTDECRNGFYDGDHVSLPGLFEVR